MSSGQASPRPVPQMFGRLLRVVVPDDNFPVVGAAGQGVRWKESQRENVIAVLL